MKLCNITFREEYKRIERRREKKHTTTNIVYILAMWENWQERETSDKTKKHRKKEAKHRNSQHSDKIILNLKTSTTFAMELCIHANVAPQQKHTWDRNKWRQQRNNRMHKHTHTQRMRKEHNKTNELGCTIIDLTSLKWNQMFGILSIEYIYIYVLISASSEFW